jgi:hypothetical protein
MLWRYCRDQKQGRHILVSTTGLFIRFWHCCIGAAYGGYWLWSTSRSGHFPRILQKSQPLQMRSECFRQKCAVVQDSLSCYAIICSFVRNAICRFAPNTLPLPVLLPYTSLVLSLTSLCSLVSFSQLQKQIIDLATTHFVHLPVRPPAEDLAQVPSNLPSFLGDTIASRYVYDDTWLFVEIQLTLS